MSSLVSRAAWLVVLCLSVTAPALADTCPAGEWLRPADGIPTAPELFVKLARQDVVMREQHDNADHHRWQLHTLAGLQARRPELVIGMEMLPAKTADAGCLGGRRARRGQFLARSEVVQRVGLRSGPLLADLHFARLHRIPVKAINITPTCAGAWWMRPGVRSPGQAVSHHRTRTAG
ncbi:hypothetical protein DSL92_04210 [Billgrantia gudaonensis]|uniref:Haem-binding uptake Tiki superfamily ChaN domain-containing protein n=1 Tax=Billgrantia gudaonensis TaxID=376427 RepID=A0A432JK81_9GAMM|nr:hypothetical protein DSL92_04210 [Halomonas gudaonensis]